MDCCKEPTTVNDSRKSKFDMISVEEAIEIVLRQSSFSYQEESVSIMNSCGRIVSKQITASDPFPSFPASIMDGYAVHAPLEPGIFPVQDRIWAGDEAIGNTDKSTFLKPGHVVYITTGAMIPSGANAVIKIEDTDTVNSKSNINESSERRRRESNETEVKINVSCTEGTSIRQIGSDINVGEIILQKGQVIGSAEVGLLATTGVSNVMCYKKPVVGVLSTGNELVNAWETPVGSQIRDSNRASLISAFQSEGNIVIDLGIVRDVKTDLAARLGEAGIQCDIVVTSGGVSMGEADLVKPMLESLGTIHFGRLNMKPGKPTTFATIDSNLSNGEIKKTLFFGLPGNPVSCLVTKSLFIDPALKRLQGLDSSKCMHSQVIVKLEEDIKLDPERPEYHRGIISIDSKSGGLIARSTGNQRSSRLLSMSSSNALLCLPQANGVISKGSMVSALLTGSIPSPPHTICYHTSASSIDFLPTPPPLVAKPIEKRPMRVGLLTVSDRASQGIYKDESGPEMEKLLGVMTNSLDWPLAATIVVKACVADDITQIQDTIKSWTDGENNIVDVVLTSGGTGFGIRDFTPEAIKPLLDREAPGIAQALLNEGLKFTPLAVLSRPVAGMRKTSLICTLPGSVKAVRENITALKPILPRIMELIHEGQCIGIHEK